MAWGQMLVRISLGCLLIQWGLRDGSVAGEDEKMLGLVEGGVVFSSSEGRKLLAEAATSETMALINYMETQPDLGKCGSASSVAVLNAFEGAFPPRAPPEALFYDETLSYRFWNVPAFVGHHCVQQVMKFSGRVAGFSIEELATILRCVMDDSNSSKFPQVKVYLASQFSDACEMEKILAREVLTEGTFVIANINHALIGETGGGHFSPIGAYHKGSSRFLFLDTARYKFPYVWVKASNLFTAMNTEDTRSGKTRGFIVLSSGSKQKLRIA